MTQYPKRLIEVDLPIKRISAHARREKSIRHGHISTLHIWWARRPLAACRAVICAALWPDPADADCPLAFREAAARIILDFARKVTNDTKLANEHCSPENFKKWSALVSLFGVPPSGGQASGSFTGSDTSTAPSPEGRTPNLQLRSALLDFIADFANWDNSTVREYLDTSRALTGVAHASLTDPDFKPPPDGSEFLSTLNQQLSTRAKPLVVDPFAGGGSIPLEALRVGADAFASDLNPVAVLLNKVVLEYIPKYGQRLADEVRKWGEWIKREAEKELAEFYPKDADGATPIAYLWARTIQCEGPGCGAEVPLMRSLWLAKKANRSVGLQLVPNKKAKRVDFQIIVKKREGWVVQKRPAWAHDVSANPKGIASQSPGLRATSYPGFVDGGETTPTGLRPPHDEPGHNPVGVDATPTTISQGSSSLATLGCGPEFLRDSAEGGRAPRVVAEPKFDGTVKRGSATCLCCGYTTPVDRVREQLRARRGGANDARLMCVVTLRSSEQGQFYRLALEADLRAAHNASAELERRKKAHNGSMSLVPDEKLDLRGIRHTWAMIYGPETWGDFFTSRQALALSTFGRFIRKELRTTSPVVSDDLFSAVQSVLALAANKCADYWTTMATWMPRGTIGHGFTRQAVPMTWDFAEANPLADFHCAWHEAFDWVAAACETEAASQSVPGHAARISATHQSLPDDSAHALITDPPYYDAVPYSFLSDFFYVWLRRSVADIHPEILRDAVVPKDEEIVVDRPHELSNSTHDIAFYERELAKAFSDSRRVLRPDGIGTIVFASKTTPSWEAILKAVVDAGWIITGSWPIDTEREARVSAQGQARLASSVHLVCRPRPDAEAAESQIANRKSQIQIVGDWRDVLQELPRRIHEWMPRLAEEGVVGADAIFACLGPALEIYSRYSRVEKASGEAVTLKEHLEQVWAAVAKEALSMVFAGADTTGFEPDARLTAMWLWTLQAGDSTTENAENAEEEEAGDDDSIANRKSQIAKAKGFVLEYDAARKIAQGLGAHLEDLTSVVEVSGETARLLPVGERARHLFGKDEGKLAPARKKKEPQLDLFKVLEQAHEGATTFGETKVERHGETVLDRIHQSMILFAAGRGEALKRFLVEDGIGRDQRYWRLAQALSALYPSHTEEKRWIDGVLARKKGLGF